MTNPPLPPDSNYACQRIGVAASRLSQHAASRDGLLAACLGLMSAAGGLHLRSGRCRYFHQLFGIEFPRTVFRASFFLAAMGGARGRQAEVSEVGRNSEKLPDLVCS